MCICFLLYSISFVVPYISHIFIDPFQNNPPSANGISLTIISSLEYFSSFWKVVEIWRKYGGSISICFRVGGYWLHLGGIMAEENACQTCFHWSLLARSLNNKRREPETWRTKKILATTGSFRRLIMIPQSAQEEDGGKLAEDKSEEKKY